jgi:hypothetical protein
MAVVEVKRAAAKSLSPTASCQINSAAPGLFLLHVTGCRTMSLLSFALWPTARSNEWIALDARPAVLVEA